MKSRRNLLTIGLLCAIVLCTNADNSVNILSKYGQLVTSSTLNWIQHIHYANYKHFVIGGFEYDGQAKESKESKDSWESEDRVDWKRPIFVCRALHSGMWVAGGQTKGDKYCAVSLLGNVHRHERYELLENVDNAARISWEFWDKYHTPPAGTVSTGKVFIARHVVPDDDSKNASRHSHYVGFLNNEGLGSINYVKDDGTEGSSFKGEILVETEPIRYELKAVKLNHARRRVEKRFPRVLGKATIRNTGESSGIMAEAFAYSYNYSVYWGQGHAVLKGLNTSISLTNHTRLPNIVWGIEERRNVTDVHDVKLSLEPGTAVEVTLTANYTETELPYSGQLIAHYADGATRARVMTGIRKEETLIDVKPEMGPIYFLSNNSLVPTTTQEPTTTERTTIFTTMPTTTVDMNKFDQSTTNEAGSTLTENAVSDETSILTRNPEVTSVKKENNEIPQSLRNGADYRHQVALALALLSATIIVVT